MSQDSELHSPAHAWLERQGREWSAERDSLARREETWSWLRLALFVAFVVLLFPIAPWPARLAGGAAASAGFVFAVARHLDLRRQRELADLRLLALAESAQRCGGAVVCIRDWRRPADDALLSQMVPAFAAAESCWTLSDQELDDLDLYSAPVGIFGLLHRCSTPLGAFRLRDMLERPMLARTAIERRQACVRWLAERPLERLRLMAAAATLRQEEKRLCGVIAAIHGTTPLRAGAPLWVWRTWSGATALTTAAAAAQLMVGNWSWQVPLYVVLTLNALFFARFRKRVRAALAQWRDVSWAIRGFGACVQQARTDLASASPGGLAELHGAFAAIDGPLLPALARRLAWTDGGGAVQTLLNLVLLHDLHLAASITTRVAPDREALLRALAALGELEALASLAAFAWEQPVACWPELADAPGVAIEDGRHPLIDPGRVAPNDVELNARERMWVVTGSNMAGKSTFLRMVGLSTLLAQVGGAAPARRLRMAPMRLMSDLRVRDSLARGESYFLAEVRHLRRMLDALADGAAPLLGLIDEPFRGTNSLDQTAASVAVVRRLLRGEGLFLVATHDRELTRLAEDAAARNVHFRENLGAGGLVFDYRLHAGPAETRNALRVLEMEGYPPELVADARAWRPP